MHRNLILFLISVSALLPLRAGNVGVMRSGADLEIRLLTPVSSRSSRAGDPVKAVVIAPVDTASGPVLLQGAILSGHVSSAQSIGLGLRRSAADITLSFDNIRLEDGSEFPVQARVEQVETARERVDTQGRVTGIDPAANLSSAFSFIMSTVLVHTELELPALVFKLLAVRSPDSEISLPAGTELFVRLTGELNLSAAQTRVSMPASVSFEDLVSVRAALNRLPIQQAAVSMHRSSDLLNVVLLGTKEQVGAAFAAAGWTGETKHSARALYSMYHCLVLRKGFLMAPMSRLTLNGEFPTTTYQKSLDTLAKRHHARFWRQGDSNIWLGAATEDVGLTVRRMHLTHAIETNIDDERAKIVNDLWFAGCVHQASLLRRENLKSIPSDDSSIWTDGDLAVLRLGSCDAASEFPAKPNVAKGARLVQALSAVGMDVLRANPLTVGITATRMINGLLKRDESAALPRQNERASIGNNPSDQLVQR